MNKNFTGKNLPAQILNSLILGFLFFGGSILLAASTAKEIAAQNKTILWDFRKNENKTQNFTKSETTAVLTFLFGDKWDKDLSIDSRVSGSFTKPGAKQTLYYVGGCEEGEGFQSTANCSHAVWWNAGRIAIYEGTTPVMKIKAALGYQILKVSDVNGDGINEILSVAGFTNMGETATSATLSQIAGGKYQEIKSFTASSDVCGAASKAAQISKAAVISYVPTTNGKFPDFSEEYFQSRCESSQWKKITKKQFSDN